MNKKKLTTIVSAIVMAIAVFSSSTTVQASQEIRVATRNTNSEAEWTYVNFPSDLKPVIINDRVYLPLRSLEGVGLIDSVGWYSRYEDDKRAPESLTHFAGIFLYQVFNQGTFFTINPNSDYVAFYNYFEDEDWELGSESTARAEFTKAYLDSGMASHLYRDGALGGVYTSPVPSLIVNDRMMIPLRMLEYMGHGVSWDAKTKTVRISYFAI